MYQTRSTQLSVSRPERLLADRGGVSSRCARGRGRGGSVKYCNTNVGRIKNFHTDRVRVLGVLGF